MTRDDGTWGENYRLSTRRPVAILIAFVFTSLAGSFSASRIEAQDGAFAPGWDGVRCYKVRDAQSGAATLDVVGGYLGETLGCAAKVRARYVCEPSMVAVSSSTITLSSEEFSRLSTAQICYAVRCPSTYDTSPIVFRDRFGSREMTGLKASLVCVPASIGAVYDIALRVNQTAALAALEFNIDLSSAPGRFEVSNGSLVCDLADDLPDDALLELGTIPGGNVRGVLLAPSSPLVGATTFATCRFVSLGAAPTLSSMPITTTEAVTSSFVPISGATVVISAISLATP